MGRTLYGAVEAGGTKFICEVADTEKHILAHTRIPTTTPQATLAAVQEFFAAQLAQDDTFAGIGIAAFGPLDLCPDSASFGHILDTPKPHWSRVDLVSPFAQHFKCPVFIDTDVNAAALAEARSSAAQNCRNLVYVTVGTGIGGGICIREAVLHGSLHAEMGHIRVLRHSQDSSFPGCCPFHGDCLEGLASGTAIVARYGASLDELPLTHEAHRIIAYYLGQLASTIILLLSPQRLVFGGGVMQDSALYEGIRSITARLLNGYAGPASAAAMAELIVPPALGTRSGIAGALWLAQQSTQEPAQFSVQ